MTRQRNPEGPKIGEKVKQALAGLALKQWKTPYAAAKALGLSETTLRRHMRGGGKSRADPTFGHSRTRLNTFTVIIRDLKKPGPHPR